MKKVAALLLTGALMLSLAGCAGTGDATDQESLAGTQSSVTVEESSEPESESSTEPESQEAEVTPPEGYLREVFAEHGMKVGTCLTTQMIKKPELNQLILEQFSSVTMENAMKPESILSKQKSIDAGDIVVEFNKDMITMLDWAKENNMPVRGHTLVWYSQTPDWIFYKDFDKSKGLVSREEMLSRMESMIRQMFDKLEEEGYIDLFYAYDIVNEAWNDDGSIRDNYWKKIIGDEYLWYAFYYADKYAPETIDLYYNDYNEQFKTNTLLKFVETLVDDEGRYLIDGVGFQGHLYTKDDLDAYFKTVDALSATGLKIELTELDVSLGAWQKVLPSTDENLKVQGQFYYELVNGLFERVDAGTLNMDAMTFWGFADDLSWRKNASPLLYDKKHQPKYAYYGAMQMKEFAGYDE